MKSLPELLHVHRSLARRLLAAAETRDTAFGTLRVLGLERLIAFKLQEPVNDWRRTQDLENIRALLWANRDTVRVAELREYFRVFDREDLLDELLAVSG